MLPTVLRPHLLAETAVPPRSTLGRTPTGNWTVTAGGELTVLDPGLLIAARFPLPAGGSGTHAVAPDTSCAALALPDRLVVVGPGGRTRWEVHHPAWGEGESGSAWITGAGTVWAVVPSADGPGAPDHWWMLDAGTGAALQDFALDCHSTGSDPIPYPDGLLLGLSSADQAGQGFRVYAATLTGPPGVRRLPGTRRAPADVHPAGDRYLTTTQ
ncbi:MAG TPA: hypothetical protein VFP72_12500, partial [Kineosporiaceae bacterium]|nr:hypothetical protein [Kineosporiaceae bacterium]